MTSFDKFSLLTSESILAVEIPANFSELGHGWLYYAFCAIVFITLGIICGHLIWKKGHMQTQDAEMEIAKAEQDLQSLLESVELEERELGSGEESHTEDIA